MRLSIALVAGLCAFFLMGPAHAGDVFSEAGVMNSIGKNFASDFTLMGVDGKEHSLAEYKGKVVLLNFWGTWCEPCREEMPALERLWKGFKDKGLVIVAVALDRGSIHKVGEFCRMSEVTFPVLLDPSGDVKDAWAVTMFPTSFVVGRDGLIKGRINGPRPWDNVASNRLFETLLTE